MSEEDHVRLRRERLKRLLVGEWSFRRMIESVIFIYVCLLIFALAWSDRMIFQPQSPGYEDSAEIIKVDAGNGRQMSALYLVNPGARYTVLYNHANAEDIGDCRPFFEEYCRRGFSVFSYDYAGYGTSPGRPTTRNACRYADVALKYLVEHEKLPLSRIILHGRSVGGGPALYLARKNRTAGVIVESSFVTAFRVLTRIPLTPFDKFRNISRIGKVGCPVLVIHGTADDTIPPWHGDALFRKARDPKMMCRLEGATHNEMPATAETAYWKAISSFAEMCTRTTDGGMDQAK